MDTPRIPEEENPNPNSRGMEDEYDIRRSIENSQDTVNENEGANS